MKAEFLKIAGVKSEAEFYKKFPSEEAFMKKHGKAVKQLMAKRAKVGAMIPNIESSRTNPMPVRTTQESLYDMAALRTGQQTVQEQRQRALQDLQAATSKAQLQALSGNGQPLSETTTIPESTITIPTTTKKGYVSTGPLTIEGYDFKSGGKVKKAQDGGGIMDILGKGMGYLDAAMPIIGDISNIANMIDQQKRAVKAARQSTAVAEIAAQAAGTMPEQVERQYVRPEDIENTGEEFFPIYGVGTNVLAKNGGMFSDPGYVPLVNPNKQKAFAQGGVLGSNSYLVPKAQDGIGQNIKDLFAGFTENPSEVISNVYGGGAEGAQGMQYAQQFGFTDAGSQIGGKIGGTAAKMLGLPPGVGSFIGSGIGDLIDRSDRRIANEQRKTEKANLKLASATVAPAIQANYASHVRNGGKIPSNPSMLDTMAMGGDVKTTWGGKVETVSYNPYAGGESIEFKGNSHDYRDPRTGQTGIGVAYGKDSVANNEAVVEVENEPAQQLRDGGGSENLVVYGDLKIPEEYIPEINDERAKGMKFKNYVSNVLNKDEAKINQKMEKAAEKGLEADNTKWDKLEISTADAIINGGDMKLKSIADKKTILADLQNALNETFDEYGIKGNEFIAKNKVVMDPERMEIAKDGKKVPKLQESKAGDVSKDDFNRQVPEEFKTEEEAIAAGYVKQADGRLVKYEDGETKVAITGDVNLIKERQSLDPDTDLYGGITMSDVDRMKKQNTWYDWKNNFDLTKPKVKGPDGTLVHPDVLKFQEEACKKLKAAGQDCARVDGKLGKETVSINIQETKETPKTEKIAKVAESTTETTTTAAPKGIVPLGAYVPPRFDNLLDPNQLLGEQYAMATNQVQPVFAQGYSPQLRVPYDISLQTAKNDVIAQSRALERNPALRDNPAALANLQARTYAALNKINAEEFRQNQQMKDTVYSANIDALNKARIANLGIYNAQADKMTEAASKTRTQNIDILSSISDKYAQNRRENMLERIYGNMYPSYAYDKDGNLIQVRGTSFSIPGQGMVGGYPGFTNIGGVAGGVQNVLAGAQAVSELLKRKRGPISEAVQPIRFKDARLDFKPDMQRMISESMPKYPGEFGGLGQPGRYSEGLTEYTPGPFSIGNQYSFSYTPQQRETMYFESLKPELPVGNVTAQLMQDPTLLSQQPSENWWEQEPKGKKGKTIKKNNKNSNILRALKNL